MDTRALEHFVLTSGRVHPRGGAGWLDGVVEHLQALDPDLLRVAIQLRVLHPLAIGRSHTWWRGRGQHVEVHPHEVTLEQSIAYTASPVARLHRGEVDALRARIRPGEPDAYPVVKLIREAGGTDYLALALPAHPGVMHVLSVATSAPGGLSDALVAALRRLVPAFTASLDQHVLRDLTVTLVNTYVGRTAGTRVLDGAIHRGARQQVDAVVWSSDLRGFTALAEAVSSDELLATLDAVFEVQVDAIQAEGGDVLKFIGDGLLAVFPVGDDAEAAARGAVRAARVSVERVLALGHSIGVGLHRGPVSFGNVGAASRLDFTVLGLTVNVAARIEALTKVVGAPAVATLEVAKLLDEPLPALGAHAVRGVSEPVELLAVVP